MADKAGLAAQMPDQKAQVSHVLREVIVATSADPIRVAMPAPIESHRVIARVTQERRHPVEGMGMLEKPMGENHDRTLTTPIQIMQTQSARLEVSALAHARKPRGSCLRARATQAALNFR